MVSPSKGDTEVEFESIRIATQKNSEWLFCNGRISSYKECLTLSKKIGYNLRKQYGGF